MKKLVLVLVVLVSINTFAQKKGKTAITAAKTLSDSIVVDTVKTDSKWSKYVAIGLSMSSGNSYDTNDNIKTFKESSYPSIELGVSRENISFGAVLGRGNLKGLFASQYTDKDNTRDGEHYQTSDRLSNYYWEVKAVPSFPLGAVSANLIFGIGSYMTQAKGSMFIEYGSGIAYTSGKITYGLSYSNWDGMDYITPSLSYSF